MKRGRRLQSGLTLIELLISIVVVIVLVAVLAGVFGKTTNTVDRVGCVNNLRELIRAVQTYASDHQQTYPGPTPVTPGVNVLPNMEEWGWGPPKPPKNVGLGTRLAAYSRVGTKPNGDFYLEALICPAGRRAGHASHYTLPTVLIGDVWTRVSGHSSGYLTGNDSSTLPRRVSEITTPGSTIYALDVVSRGVHGEAINVSFMDGHVENVPVERVKQAAGGRLWIE